MSRTTLLSEDRRLRALKVGVAATAALYLLTIFVAEPMRGFAIADSEDVVVQLTVADILGLSCDGTDNDPNAGSGQTVSLGTITISGDTGAYSSTRAAICFLKTSNNAGADFGWYIKKGTGGYAGPGANMTGYLISTAENAIAPFGAGSGQATATWSVTAGDARWGVRISSTSSGAEINGYNYGTDSSSEKWNRVKTGSVAWVRRLSSAITAGSGAVFRIGFRAQIGTLKNQASGTYETPYATGTGGVIFTAISL